MEGEISGWDRLEPMETLFHFSPLLSPKCPSRMDSPPIPSHQFFRLSLGDWKALPTFPLNSYFPILSGRNIISISFYPLLKDPHGVSALHLLRVSEPYLDLLCEPSSIWSFLWNQAPLSVAKLRPYISTHQPRRYTIPWARLSISLSYFLPHGWLRP